MRILLDQNMPRHLEQMLMTHEVIRASRAGWAEIENGELIAAAEKAGFDVLLTGDQRIRYQQNLTGRRIALVVLSSNNWNHIKDHPEQINAAIARAGHGTYEEVILPRPQLIRRPPSSGRA